MTTSSATPRVTYQGSGSTGPFSIPFFWTDPIELFVTRTESDGVTEIYLTSPTDFTATGANSLSGSLTLATTLAANQTLTIERRTAMTQLLDLNRTYLDPEQLEAALDKLTRICQDSRDIVARSLRLFRDDTSGSGAYSAAGNKISQMANGTAATDATTLSQVNALITNAFDAAAVSAATTVPGGLFEAGETGDVQRTFVQKARDILSVLDFGAVQDSTTDNTAAFNAALATGKPIYVPNARPGYFYRITNTLHPINGSVLFGDKSRPEIRMDSGSVEIMFDLSGHDDVEISSLTLNGNKAVTPTGQMMIKMASSNRCRIVHNTILDAPGSLAAIWMSGTSNDNHVSYNDIRDAEASAIGFSGSGVSHSQVVGNKITDCVGFGVRIGDGAHDCLVQNNETLSNGIELVGTTQSTYGIRIIGNHAEGCGDNGISVSGYDSIVVGNRCYNNLKAGIFLWGSFNTVVGNHCLNNDNEDNANEWPGIGVTAEYGGAGQYNIITGNVVDDNRAVPIQNGIRLYGNSTDLWTNGATFGAATYCYYGLNIYRTSAGGTTGATPPTHTTGTVSDGGVSWEYIRTALDPIGGYNQVIGNSVIRSEGNAYLDLTTYATNSIQDPKHGDFGRSGDLVLGTGTQAGWTSINQLSIKRSGNSGIAIESGASSIGRVSFGDTTFAGAIEYSHASDTLSLAAGASNRVGLTSSSLRPTTNGGLDLGTTALGFSNIYFATGGTINWANGDVVATHSSNTLAFTGASSGYTFDALLAGQVVRATGDAAGSANTVQISNVSDTTANSTGVGSIKFKGATSRDSVGFIKIYVGTTAYYVPIFAAITG